MNGMSDIYSGMIEPEESTRRLEQHDGEWFYVWDIPDVNDYSGPFFGGHAENVSMTGCTLWIPAGIGAIEPATGEPGEGT